VFEDALAAFAELVADESSGEPARHDVSAAYARGDRAGALVAWLEELVYLADTAGFVPERLARLELRDAAIRARIEGARSAPRQLVKAVTYHGLRFGHENGAWHARVVLDV
jgi:SHS2 domain-containing protein